MVIDAVGACIKDAVDWVRSSGRVLLFGLNFAAQQTICQTNITRKDLTVMGCYIGIYTWKKTVQLLENVPMKLEEMITHRLSLEEFRKRVRGDEGWKRSGSCDVSQWKIEYCDMIREQVFIFFMKACSFYCLPSMALILLVQVQSRVSYRQV